MCIVELHHPTGITDPPPKGFLMAINPENYADNSFWEIHGIQKVYIDDYNGMKAEIAELDAELAIASEVYKSGQTDSAPALRKVEKLVRKKVQLKLRAEDTLKDINALGRILDERDGTIAAGQAAN